MIEYQGAPVSGTDQFAIDGQGKRQISDIWVELGGISRAVESGIQRQGDQTR